MNLTENLDKFERTPKLLEIVKYPHNVLTMVSEPVKESIVHNTPLQELLEDMEFTLQSMNAVGLSAVQVGIPIRVFLVQDKDRLPITMINPVIKSTSNDTLYENEGCLSVPGVYTRILRSRELEVEYFDGKGELQRIFVEGLLARAVAHEMDHLDGKVFFDRMNKIQKDSILKKYKKFKKNWGI